MNRLANPPEWELYDLESDPIEFHNVADQAKMNEVKERLRLELAKWQDQTKDPFRDQEFSRAIEAKYRARRKK